MKLFRVTTLSSQLNLLLKGQFSFFISNGFEVYGVSANNGDHVTELMKREKCKWLFLPISRFFNPIYDIISLTVLIYYFIKYKPDIVHTHSPKAGLLGQLAAFICGVPFRVHTVAGLPLVESQGIMKVVLTYVEKLTYSLSHWVLPNSRNMVDYLLTNRFVRKDKLHLLGNGSTNGVNSVYYSCSREIIVASRIIKEELNISDDSSILLYVGRVASSKGIAELIYAYETLKNKIPNLYLLLVGNFDEKDVLPLNVSSLISSESKIICTNHVHDIRPYLFLCDLFVFPSYREGLPQSLLQACSMSKCCIATDISGCNELIEHNISGFLVPVKNVNAIINSVETLLSNKLLRDKFGLAAREHVVKNYDQNYLWNELKEFYRSKNIIE
jgi:glycosyltransferase involved in cell wall biosynthesis